MLNKLPNSAIAIALLFGLAGIPQIADSSESKLITKTTIAQANTDEVPPDTEDRGGASWYWLLLLLIPLGLGGLLLARRTPTNADTTTSTPNTPATSANNKLTSPESNQIVNANLTPGATGIPKDIEPETTLTREPDSYNFDNNSQVNNIEVREDLASSNVNGVASQAAVDDRPSDTNTEAFLEDSTTRDLDFTSNSVAINNYSEVDINRATEVPQSESKYVSPSQAEIDSQEIALESEADAIFGLNNLDRQEISLDEITFDERSQFTPTLDTKEDDELTEWLASLEGTENDSDLDDISEWLDSLEADETTSVTNGHSTKTTVDADDNYSELVSIHETTYMSDDDAFEELQNLLDEDSNRRQQQ
ncbi:hypothetical protein [Myxosarcina sp. GI1]|uniref:hypothetical protein n=1 Tax=Myxosarcina sp. GI1 TaxID=1541065 RepID=UPI0005604CA0|nr:hypothetical protein [Myxosarcina sp. GI1]